MSNIEKPINRSTASIIAKCAVILVVLGVVCFFSIWAWFTQTTKATADGINVIAKGEGVEVSWDDKDYYYNLTALTETEKAADTTGKTGMAKYLNEDKSPYGLKLITGNGTKFFEPYLNRRTGDVFLNTDKSWDGVEITDSNSSGRYIDVDLYFRSTVERNVWLAGNSRVKPKDTTLTSRPSDYGSFSRDYIAGASRVAFLPYTRIYDETTKTVSETLGDCSFIWAPNADYKLSEGDGYKKHTTVKDITTSVTTGGDLELDNFKCKQTETDYYFWTIKDDLLITEEDKYNNGVLNTLESFSARELLYDNELEFYVAEITFIIPTYDDGNPSIPMFINDTNDPDKATGNNFDQDVLGNDSRLAYEQSDKGQNFGITSSSYNIGNLTSSNALYILNKQINPGQKITFKVGYNPDLKHLVILNYKAADNSSYTRGGEETTTTTTVYYYELDNTDTSCALVNPTGGVAVSASDFYMKSVYFTDENKTTVKPVSITTTELFTAHKEGTGLDAKYTFAFNDGSGKYLKINNGDVDKQSTASEFTLEYKDNDTGPILVSGDYCLVYQSGKMQAVKYENLTDLSTVVTIYEGTMYTFSTGQEIETSYIYYDNDDKTTNELSATSTPPLFTSTSTSAESLIIGNDPIVTLTKPNPEDDYYTAHIVMRIWVEGTDREAKTPLADGIFNLDLHFTSNPDEKTTTE